MKIFIDSADLEQIEEAFSWGIVDGITTNPSLIKSATAGKDVNMAVYLQRILEAAKNMPVSIEVEGELEGKIRGEQMVKEAVSVYNSFKAYNSALNIKIPINPALDKEDQHQFEGLTTIKALAQKGIPVNATLIMTPEQALLAAKAGAKYISPFMGRIDDYVKSNTENGGIQSGVQLIKEIMGCLNPYQEFKDVEVIGASIRDVIHARECAKAGVQIATIPFNVLKEMVGHDKTYEGVKRFKADMVPEYKEVLRG